MRFPDAAAPEAEPEPEPEPELEPPPEVEREAEVMQAPDAAADALPPSSPPDAGAQADTRPEPAVALDVCGDVSSAGRCLSPSQLELCVVATGASPEQLVQVSCAAGEQCVAGQARARCVALEPCSDGATRCAAGGVETCTEQRWQLSSCAGDCVGTPLGAWCAPEAATRVVSGHVEYERRLPNRGLSDWGATELTAARGFLVLSYHADELVDATLSADDGVDPGAFSLRVRTPSAAEDSLVVVAAGVADDQQLAFAVADPGFTPSSRARGVGSRTGNAAVWSYRFDVDEAERVGRLTIREQHGSGACHVFDRLRQVFGLARDHYKPALPERVLVWLGMGTQWSCGACTALSPVKVFDSSFAHQVWLDGSRDEGYWSDPVTAHELGHYVMNAHGYPAGEGGPHYLGIPTHPGQAFSEGWATFFASLAREDSLYFDKQGGAFFWWDLDRRAYSARGVLWLRALAALGLLQRMDENEVAAILWQSYRALDRKAPLLDALASERMTRAPFARGYTRRIWEDPEQPEEFESTTQPLPFLADYLDALRRQLRRGRATRHPGTDHLLPLSRGESAVPLNRSLLMLLLALSLPQGACEERAQRPSDGSEDPSAVAPAAGQRAGNTQGPIASMLSGPPQVAPGELAELRLRIDRRALHQQVPIEVQLRLPPDVVLEQGAEQTVVSPGGEPHAELRYVVRPLARSRAPLQVVIDARGEGFGYHAELPYYFEGHPPLSPGPARAAGEVRVGRRNFGQSVAVGLGRD